MGWKEETAMSQVYTEASATPTLRVVRPLAQQGLCNTPSLRAKNQNAS